MQKCIAALAALAVIAPIVSATYGVDVSQATGPSAWKCLNGQGFDFAVIRCWESVGRADPNCPRKHRTDRECELFNFEQILSTMPGMVV